MYFPHTDGYKTRPDEINDCDTLRSKVRPALGVGFGPVIFFDLLDKFC